jgi:hypothetical protein
MGDTRHRAWRGLAWLAGAFALAACVGSPAGVTTRPPHATAVAACTDALGGGWQVAVEVDRDDSSTLALTSGDSIATCQAGRNADRTGFGTTATGVGTHPTTTPPALSYLTWAGPDKPSFFVGRVPPAAAVVRVTFDDGSEQTATVGNGLWLAWLEQPNDVEPVAIDALDASGTSISQLADPDGIQPAD